MLSSEGGAGVGAGVGAGAGGAGTDEALGAAKVSEDDSWETWEGEG